jgi:hypothetical protein
MHHKFQLGIARFFSRNRRVRSSGQASAFRFIKSKEMFTQHEIGSILSLTKINNIGSHFIINGRSLHCFKDKMNDATGRTAVTFSNGKSSL